LTYQVPNISGISISPTLINDTTTSFQEILNLTGMENVVNIYLDDQSPVITDWASNSLILLLANNEANNFTLIIGNKTVLSTGKEFYFIPL
jgi:hypothetical protein